MLMLMTTKTHFLWFLRWRVCSHVNCTNKQFEKSQEASDLPIPKFDRPHCPGAQVRVSSESSEVSEPSSDDSDQSKVSKSSSDESDQSEVSKPSSDESDQSDVSETSSDDEDRGGEDEGVEVSARTTVEVSANGYDDYSGSAEDGGCGQDGCLPELTRDGDVSDVSRWSCRRDFLTLTEGDECEITFDFGERQDILSIQIYVYQNDALGDDEFPLEVGSPLPFSGPTRDEIHCKAFSSSEVLLDIPSSATISHERFGYCTWQSQRSTSRSPTCLASTLLGYC